MPHPRLLLPNDNRNVRGAAYSPDGRHIATIGQDLQERQVSLFITDSQSGKEVHKSDYIGSTNNVASTPDNRFVSAIIDYTVYVWTWENSNLRQIANINYLNEGLTLQNSSLAISPNGKYVATITSTSTSRLLINCRIWDVASGKEVVSIKLTPQIEMKRLVFSSTDNLVVITYADRTARVFTFEQDKYQEIGRVGSEDVVEAIAFNSDSKYLATAGNDNSLRVWAFALDRNSKDAAEPVGSLPHPVSRGMVQRIYDRGGAEENLRKLTSECFVSEEFQALQFIRAIAIRDRGLCQKVCRLWNRFWIHYTSRGLFGQSRCRKFCPHRNY